MMISALRKIGVEPLDTIIIACDKGSSWRRSVDSNYKANRKEQREAQEDIDWKLMYGKMEGLLERLDKGTDWYIVKADHLEADDWMAVGSRYFKDEEVVLVSFDADIEQLCSYSHVKIFSPKIKMKGKKGGYKIVKDPYLTLSKKIIKEQADNLIAPIKSEQDYEKRKSIVSLLELPGYIEEQCMNSFENLPVDKDINPNYIPFESLRNKITNLYNDKSSIVTYEECLQKKEKKKAKRRAK